MKKFEKDLKASFGKVKLFVEYNGEVNIRMNDEKKYGFIQTNLKISSKRDFEIKKIQLKATVPILDIHGISIPGFLGNIYSFFIPWHFEEKVSLHRGFPFASFINRNGTNKLAIGLKESWLGYKLKGKFIEKAEEMEITLESINSFEGKEFNDSIFISEENMSWFEITKIYSSFAGKDKRFSDFMYEPVYCTWYAFYQDLNQEYLNQTAEKAHEIGFKVFILDDGWFTSDNSRGYWYTGDWEVCDKKFPDFKEHVRFVKSLGMKYVLWIAPFMVGLKSQAFKNFKDVVVSKRERLGYANLCPQSSLTRKRIIGILENLLEKYDLDGFKIDFLDDLPVKSCRGDHDHFTDYPSLGLLKILSEITELGKKAGKDLIIEARQGYVSPQIAEYVTAFRAADTPFDFDQNRRRILTIRSFSGVTPVYSDPIVWRKGESFQNISKHFISTIYSVPMLSLDLLKITKEEEKLIKFWIGFHESLRELALFGDLRVGLLNGEITKACSVEKSSGLCSLYGENLIDLDEFGEFNELYILNSSNEDDVLILSDYLRGKRILVEIKSWRGVKMYERTFEGVLRVTASPEEVIHIVREMN